MLSHRTFALVVLLCLAVTAAAEESKGGPDAYKRLKYRLIGPAAGGRVCRAAGVPGDPRTYYAATAAGGLWKSSDGGFRWQPIMDAMRVSSIGSLAIAPSDSQVIYVGTGEANIRGNVEVGNGIYRSSDAGKTWKHVWKQEGQIGTMIVHPSNPDVAYAAVLGKAFGPGQERGVFRTTDGGTTWKRILFKNADTGASDVCFDPNNPRVLFAGLWQVRRRPWELTSGGPGSGLYMSRDGGDSWTQLVRAPEEGSAEAGKPAAPGTKRCKGLPEGIWGKIGLAVAPSNSKRIYALIEAEKGGLFRSDDGGDSWERINANRALRQRAWYFSTLTVHPRNADVVYFPQVPLLRSIDGGKTLQRVAGPHHGDHHDLWIDPKNPERMIDSNDGGVDITVDGGASWYAPPLPISQFYHISVDNRVPYRVSGNMQDLGTAQGPSNSLLSSGIPVSAWYPVGGGETGFAVSDPTDPNIVYAGEYGGYLSRYDHRTRQAKPIGIYPFNPSGHDPERLRYRFQWTAPILISPHNPRVIYHGANVLFRTTDGGEKWQAISKDLTRNDRSKQKWSGGPITGDNTGVEVYGTLFALAESPRQAGQLWTGSDDGLVHVSSDGGKTWKSVTDGLTRAGLPEWGTVVCIEPSRFDARTAYVVVDAHRIDDRRPYLFVTEDLGATWRRLSGKMPEDGYLNVVREDPKRKGMLYAGSERGVLYSTDSGATWSRLELNLPPVRVTDLVVKDDDLVVGTNGRSVWILDDLTPIRAAGTEWQNKDIHLFPTRAAHRYRYSSQVRSGAPMNAGDNPPRGAIVHYALRSKPKGDLVLRIRDSKGTLVRTLTSKKEREEPADAGAYSGESARQPLLPTAPGLHRFIWDLCHEGAERIHGARVDSGSPRPGPLVVPGTYTLELEADGKKATTMVEVRPDPRLGARLLGELAEQEKFTLRLRDDITRLTRIAEPLRSLRKQLQARDELIKEEDRARELVQATKAFLKKLDELEGKLHNPKAEVTYDILAQKGGAQLYSQLIWLFELLKDADGAPNQGIREMYAEQVTLLNRYEAEWHKLVKEDLAALNAQARKLDLPIVIVPTTPGSGRKSEPRTK